MGHLESLRWGSLQPLPQVFWQVLDPLATFLLGLFGRGQDAALGEIDLGVVNPGDG
jgi:hypothetical protein